MAHVVQRLTSAEKASIIAPPPEDVLTIPDGREIYLHRWQPCIDIDEIICVEFTGLIFKKSARHATPATAIELNALVLIPNHARINIDEARYIELRKWHVFTGVNEPVSVFGEGLICGEHGPEVDLRDHDHES
jgi:hypothetical protein